MSWSQMYSVLTRALQASISFLHLILDSKCDWVCDQFNVLMSSTLAYVQVKDRKMETGDFRNAFLKVAAGQEELAQLQQAQEPAGKDGR